MRICITANSKQITAHITAFRQGADVSIILRGRNPCKWPHCRTTPNGTNAIMLLQQSCCCLRVLSTRMRLSSDCRSKGFLSFCDHGAERRKEEGSGRPVSDAQMDGYEIETMDAIGLTSSARHLLLLACCRRRCLRERTFATNKRDW